MELSQITAMLREKGMNLHEEATVCKHRASTIEQPCKIFVFSILTDALSRESVSTPRPQYMIIVCMVLWHAMSVKIYL